MCKPIMPGMFFAKGHAMIIYVFLTRYVGLLMAFTPNKEQHQIVLKTNLGFSV